MEIKPLRTDEEIKISSRKITAASRITGLGVTKLCLATPESQGGIRKA